MAHWLLDWKHGKVGVQSLGGMYQIQFLLPTGRTVMPMYTAPWIGEPENAGLAPMMQGMRGDWLCVPFGLGRPVAGLTQRWREVGDPETDGEAHGYAAHHEWSLIRKNPAEIALRIDPPQNHAIRQLTRVIRPLPGEPSVHFEILIDPRENVSLPVGLHPTFALPSEPGTVILEPGNFSYGMTFPGDFEPGAYPLKPDKLFDSLAGLETAAGAPIDLSRLPLEGDWEILFQLCGMDGRFDVVYVREGFRVRLQWNPEHLPSCVVWISNRGRKGPPWNGRNLALGIEPVCSAFDLGNLISRRNNPISESGVLTCIQFKADELWSTEYRIGVV
jgi:hypothetical protein